jgi:beta-glucanase (GH16 family)
MKRHFTPIVIVIAFALAGCDNQDFPRGPKDNATRKIQAKPALVAITTTDANWKAPMFKSLIWSDEFDGPAIDTANWGYETELTGWSKTWNKELQDYVDAGTRGENAFIGLDGKDSCLIIKATKPEQGKYASARMTTKGKRFWKDGIVIAARMKLPRGQGIWPAFWMLPETGDWPDAGEIDIIEMIGGNGRENTAYGNVHGPGYSGSKGIQGGAFLPKGDFSEAYHVYELRWTKKKLEWYIDGMLYHSVKAESVPGAWPFAGKDFNLLLNLAVGGIWPGNPDEKTVFPQSLYIDWVRVYR